MLRSKRRLSSSSQGNNTIGNSGSSNTRKRTVKINAIRSAFFFLILLSLIILDIQRQKRYVVHNTPQNNQAGPYKKIEQTPPPVIHIVESIEEAPMFIETTDTKNEQKSEKIDTPAIETSTDKFPTPSSMAHPDAMINIHPEFGTHRSNHDAVFTFAEDYPVETYVQFISFLRKSGYQGDVVLSVSSRDKMKPGVEEYLRQQAKPDQVEITGVSVVVYSVDWSCYSKKKGNEQVNGVRSGFTDCTTSLYGLKNEENGTIESLDDPREPRPVATARYELYWIWSLQYKRSSRILLIDVRDTYFQLDPFQGLPKLDDDVTSSAEEKEGGILHLYGENHEATSISRSNYNRRWIEGAYGRQKMLQIKDKPVICSGSTIGDAIAIEAYLRVMVKQFDITKCKMTGCDQGFHNYIYYHNVLKDVPGIKNIIVYPQGEGAVNNLAAMRTKPLREWGVLEKETNKVLNWNGEPSPIVHQFDRDDELKNIMKDKVKKLMVDIHL